MDSKLLCQALIKFFTGLLIVGILLFIPAGTILLDHALSALEAEGINKVALLVFNHNDAGNAFWEKQGFTVRDDVTYRNRVLTEMVRIDT